MTFDPGSVFLPRAGRSIDVTFLAVPFLKMALKGGRHVEALKAERADEPFLRRIPVLTVLCCSSRRVRHRLRLLRDVLQEIHLLGKSGSHPWFEGEVGLRPLLHFHFHRKMTEEGVAAAEAGRSAGPHQSCAGQYNAEQPQQVDTKPHAIGIQKYLKAVCK